MTAPTAQPEQRKAAFDHAQAELEHRIRGIADTLRQRGVTVEIRSPSLLFLTLDQASTRVLFTISNALHDALRDAQANREKRASLAARLADAREADAALDQLRTIGLDVAACGLTKLTTAERLALIEGIRAVRRGR
jgi:hypothetical protein